MRLPQISTSFTASHIWSGRLPDTVAVNLSCSCSRLQIQRVGPMCEVAYIWEMLLNKNTVSLPYYHKKNLYRLGTTRDCGCLLTNVVSVFCIISMRCHLLISSLINPHCGYRWINSDPVCSDSRHWSWYECQGNSEGFEWLHNAVINYINTEALSWLLAGEGTQDSSNFDVINTSYIPTLL